MKKYKVLTSNMKTPFQYFKMEIGKKYTCEDFDTDLNNGCSRGFYATDLEGLAYSINTRPKNRVFECEVGGESIMFNKYKQRFEIIELTREIPIKELKLILKSESEKLGYDLYGAIFPINSLRRQASKATPNRIKLLKKWASVVASIRASIEVSVRDSIGNLIRDSVGNLIEDSVKISVWNAIRDSVGTPAWDSISTSVWDLVGVSGWDSVRASLRASVWDSVSAYYSSLFSGIKKWGIIGHPELNPYQPCVDLWNGGFVPSFDGNVWRLHSGEDAKIVFEIEKENIK